MNTLHTSDAINPAISALIQGQPLNTLPEDLYIPPDALQVFLESFEGPLDLLLYLIQKQNFDILNIPLAEVTKQYLSYIGLMKELKLDLAAEYLVMAALLMQIKSQLLLPTENNPENPNQSEDPRQRLVRQIQEYARYKKAAKDLHVLPQVGRDIFPVIIAPPDMPREIIIPNIPWNALLAAMQEVMERAAFYTSHQVIREPLSVRERMSTILERLKTSEELIFYSLFTEKEGKQGVVVTLLAILELAKELLICIILAENSGTIYIRLQPSVISSDNSE